MKPFNHTKILILALLLACLLSIGFVGAASADGLTLTADPTTINTGGTVTFTFTHDANYTYTATATDQDSNPFTLSTSSPTSGSFTQTFDTAGTYTIKVEGTNKTKSDDKKSGTASVTVNNPQPAIVYTPTITSFTNTSSTTGTAPLTVSFSFSGTNATSYQLLDGSTLIGSATATSPISHRFDTPGTYTIKLRATNGTLTADSSDSITVKVNQPASTKITAINLTVTAPAKGATPATTVTTDTKVSFTGILWSESSTTFDPNVKINIFGENKQYYAKITLRNATGYVFDTASKPDVKVNGKSTASADVTLKSDGITLEVIVKTFDKTAATETNINSVSANVTAPATGNKPDTSATLGATTYEVDSITWYKDGSTTALNASTDTFAADTKYKVTIVLKSKTNYIFNNSIAKANAKINGNEPSDFTRSSDGTKITMSYTFPATTKLAGPSITFTISPEKPKIPSNANTVTVTYSYTITGNPTSATLNFGEGSTIDLGKADASGKIEGTKTHDFSSLGSFTASITAKNVNDTTEKKIDFSIGQDVLAAIIEAGPLSGPAPLTVNLNDKSTGTVTSRTWNFGDGSVTSGEASTSHTYEKAGTYTIKLTVSDGRDTKTATKTITVTAAETDDKTDETKKKINATYEPFITVGGLDIPSPFDIISEFVRLFQSMFDFDNYHVFGNATNEKE